MKPTIPTDDEGLQPSMGVFSIESEDPIDVIRVIHGAQDVGRVFEVAGPYASNESQRLAAAVCV